MASLIRPVPIYVDSKHPGFIIIANLPLSIKNEQPETLPQITRTTPTENDIAERVPLNLKQVSYEDYIFKELAGVAYPKPYMTLTGIDKELLPEISSLAKDNGEPVTNSVEVRNLSTKYNDSASARCQSTREPDTPIEAKSYNNDREPTQMINNIDIVDDRQQGQATANVNVFVGNSLQENNNSVSVGNSKLSGELYDARQSVQGGEHSSASSDSEHKRKREDSEQASNSAGSDRDTSENPLSSPITTADEDESAGLSSSETIEFVIAGRIGQNISWLLPILEVRPSTCVSLYLKGSRGTPPADIDEKPRIVALNYFSASHAYLTHIIECYYNLADIVVFCTSELPNLIDPSQMQPECTKFLQNILMAQTGKLNIFPGANLRYFDEWDSNLDFLTMGDNQQDNPRKTPAALYDYLSNGGSMPSVLRYVEGPCFFLTRKEIWATGLRKWQNRLEQLLSGEFGDPRFAFPTFDKFWGSLIDYDEFEMWKLSAVEKYLEEKWQREQKGTTPSSRDSSVHSNSRSSSLARRKHATEITSISSVFPTRAGPAGQYRYGVLFDGRLTARYTFP